MNGKKTPKRTFEETMSNGTYLSLGQAAEACGRAKSTVSKALKSGDLSYVEKTRKGYKIDPSELFRVFPKKGSETPQVEQLETQKETLENSALQARLEVMEQRLSDAGKTIEDLRTRLDAEGSERRQLTAMITDQRSAVHEAPRRGWLSKLFR